jgi:hypothetical protein
MAGAALHDVNELHHIDNWVHLRWRLSGVALGREGVSQNYSSRPSLGQRCQWPRDGPDGSRPNSADFP